MSMLNRGWHFTDTETGEISPVSRETVINTCAQARGETKRITENFVKLIEQFQYGRSQALQFGEATGIFWYGVRAEGVNDE